MDDTVNTVDMGDESSIQNIEPNVLCSAKLLQGDNPVEIFDLFNNHPSCLLYSSTAKIRFRAEHEAT
jgi:hypothetical protein